MGFSPLPLIDPPEPAVATNLSIVGVAELLNGLDLASPALSVLNPDQNNYKAYFLQPQGQIEASTAGVRNRDQELAESQFGAFLVDAQRLQADLAVTPEYSTPWSVLTSSLKTGIGPVAGGLWAIGCESIKYSELKALKLEMEQHASFVFEDLLPDDARFLDPLAYLFWTRSSTGENAPRLVVLVQFKIQPMGDDDHFEINRLQTGSRIYRFGESGQIKLFSLICSDAFAFLDHHAQTLYDRALVLHIQLAPKPRQPQYRRYRERLFAYQGDATELICLNWARNVCEWSGDAEKPWANISGSAWYLKPDQFDSRDSTLTDNHKRGLYYTWCSSLRSHALFFNYEPAAYLFQATKVFHLGVPASLSRRRGPQLSERFVWNPDTNLWSAEPAATDGFREIVGSGGPAKDAILHLASTSPFKAERVLALSAGGVGAVMEWYSVAQLDSCQIGADEIVFRLTFCQDNDPNARSFRTGRLRRWGRLWDILADAGRLPPNLGDLAAGFTLSWSSTSPHQNVISHSGKRATAIYMGEEVTVDQVETVTKRVAEYLRRTAGDNDEALAAVQRLGVWFRDEEEIILFQPHRYAQIDHTGIRSEFDIGREQ